MNAAETGGGLLPACPNFFLEKVGSKSPRKKQSFLLRKTKIKAYFHYNLISVDIFA